MAGAAVVKGASDRRHSQSGHAAVDSTNGINAVVSPKPEVVRTASFAVEKKERKELPIAVSAQGYQPRETLQILVPEPAYVYEQDEFLIAFETFRKKFDRIQMENAFLKAQVSSLNFDGLGVFSVDPVFFFFFFFFFLLTSTMPFPIVIRLCQSYRTLRCSAIRNSANRIIFARERQQFCCSFRLSNRSFFAHDAHCYHSFFLAWLTNRNISDTISFLSTTSTIQDEKKLYGTLHLFSRRSTCARQIYKRHRQNSFGQGCDSCITHTIERCSWGCIGRNPANQFRQYVFGRPFVERAVVAR